MTTLKKLLCVLVLLIGIMIGLILNIVINKPKIETYTREYIEKQGYSVDEIKDIEIMHSYMAKILGYNEWRIMVTFTKKEDIQIWFTYRDKQIVLQGVSSEPLLDKEDVIKNSDAFKNGTFLDEEN